MSTPATFAAPTLYGITAEMQHILALIEEGGGELTPELEQAMTITEEQFVAKAEDYGHAIINLRAMATAAKAEKDRLAGLQKFYENAEKRLCNAISTAMQALDHPKVETASMRLSLRHTVAVADDIDMEALPKEFKKVKVEEVADKAAIKNAIMDKADAWAKTTALGKDAPAPITTMGVFVPGARLTENVSLQIK